MTQEVRHVLATDLYAQDEDEEFSRLFYEKFAIYDTETSCPWGCPWYHGSPIVLHGKTIEEMVDTYHKEYCEGNEECYPVK